MRVHSGIERRRDLSNDAESVSSVCNRMKLWGCRWTVRYSDMNIYFQSSAQNEDFMHRQHSVTSHILCDLVLTV